MLRVAFNIQVHKSHIYYDSNQTRETCVHIGYFTHSGVLMCFLQNCLQVPEYPKISNFGYRFPK